MKRFFLATACLLGLVLGTPNRAHAQIVYGYEPTQADAGVPMAFSSYNPFGNLGNYGGLPSSYYSPFGATTYSPFGAQSYSPFGYASQYTYPGRGGLNTAANLFTPYGSQTYSNLYSPFSFANRTMAANYGPYGMSAFSGYNSPFGGLMSQTSSNIFGGGYSRTLGYNPFNGMTSGTAFDPVSRPSVVSPALGYGGSNYYGGSPYNNLLAREAYSNYLGAYNNVLNHERNASSSFNYTVNYSGSSNNGNGGTRNFSYNNKTTGGFSGGALNYNHTTSGNYNTSGMGWYNGGYNYNNNYNYNRSRR